MMSFRIDDILKKENPPVKYSDISGETHTAIDYSTRNSIHLTQFSMIQENNFSRRNEFSTNSNYNCYYRSNNDLQYSPRFIRFHDYIDIQRRSLPQSAFEGK